MIADLTPYLRGWGNYFGWCQTPSVLDGLDKWIRRRLRGYRWAQWRTARRRQQELRRLGVRAPLLAQCGSSTKPWRASTFKALQVVMPNAYFDSLGLPRLRPRRA